MIRDVANRINEPSHEYKIGELQSIRKEIKLFLLKAGTATNYQTFF